MPNQFQADSLWDNDSSVLVTQDIFTVLNELAEFLDVHQRSRVDIDDLVCIDHHADIISCTH